MTAGRLKIWNADANAWEYPPGTNGTISEITSDDNSVTITGGTGPTADLSVSGGSQSVRVIGPVTLTFADTVGDGTIIPLFDTAAGDCLLNAFYDPATAVNFNDTGPITILFGEGTPTVHGNQNWDFGLDQIAPAGSPTGASDAQVSVGTLGSDHYIGGNLTLQAEQVFAGGTYSARQRDGDMNGNAGHIDLYFVVATPTAPVLTP